VKTAKPILRRAQAEQDITEAVTYYLEQDAPIAAERFIAALETAIKHIGRNPDFGSPRYASELGLNDLRFWKIKAYPYLIFYVELKDQIDIWRILHGQRDIPSWLQDPTGDSK